MSTKIKLHVQLLVGDVEEEFEIFAEGDYVPEQKERGPSYSSGGEPGEPAYFEDLFIGIKTPIPAVATKFIDLEPFLSKKQIDSIIEKLFDAEISNRETPTYERD